MTGYYNQYHQIFAMQRFIQAGENLQIVGECNIWQVLLVAAILLQAFDMFRVVTPEPDIQPGTRQMYCQCRTP